MNKITSRLFIDKLVPQIGVLQHVYEQKWAWQVKFFATRLHARILNPTTFVFLLLPLGN